MKTLLSSLRLRSRCFGDATGHGSGYSICSRFISAKCRLSTAIEHDSSCSALTEQADEMAHKLLQGDRVSLSRSITLIESFKPEHNMVADMLLEHVLAKKDKTKPTFRVGIAGPPGAGKSTFIDSLGNYILTRKETENVKLAVLAIDPSSNITGGSILGDKTRMDRLVHQKNAFVRPTPTSGRLGGIAQHTNEVVALCECAGYDLILVETVGLGQSEVLIDDVVDFVILLTPPQMGDELQGVKKGIMEIADMVVVNKADGPLEDVAKHAAVDFKHSLQLIRRKNEKWRPRVKRVSARKDMGIEEIWQIFQEFRRTMGEDLGFKSPDNEIAKKRKRQSEKLVNECVFDEIRRRLKYNKAYQAHALETKLNVSKGMLSPRKAASNLVDLFLAPDSSSTKFTLAAAQNLHEVNTAPLAVQ